MASLDPASLYLLIVLTVFGTWLVGDRVWAMAHAVTTRLDRHNAATVKLVTAVVGAMIAVMSWRVAPVAASVVPQQHRSIVQIEQHREPTDDAMTLRTLMSSDTVMLDSKAVRSTGAVHVVVPGDCLWKIARSLLVADGLPPSGSATSDLWRSIYAMNREVIGPNPHLIFPGQVLALPGR